MRPAPVRRYRASPPWSVALLAAVAAGGAVVTTGGLSAAFSGAPPTAFARTPGHGQGVARDSEVPSAPTARTQPEASPPAAASEGWQIQVGAFRRQGAAKAQLQSAETLLPELEELAEALPIQGEMTRARFAGIADEGEARRLCGRVAEAGGRCFVVAPGG